MMPQSEIAKNGVKSTLFNLVQEAIADIVKHGKMYSLLTKNIEAFT